ncbi:MAG TPA: hypothetical protein VEJ18_21840 [Planctomycetota bacterium]|nr:hypothetical protein [Planctomycetota bacterium]
MNSAVGVAPIRGLLWREWLAHRSLVFNFLTVWLVCVWVLPMAAHPATMLVFGVLYALVVGPAFGGSELQDGTEEFAFALPPTRGERYVARLLLGLATLLGLVGIGLLAVAFSLPQAVWRLFFETGLTEPYSSRAPGFLWTLSLVAPPAVFATTFALAAVVPTASLVRSSWFFAGGLAGAAVGLGFVAENWLWQAFNGRIAVPAAAALGLGAAVVGYRLYRRKEATSDADGATGSLLITGTAVVVLLMVLAFVAASIA